MCESNNSEIAEECDFNQAVQPIGVEIGDRLLQGDFFSVESNASGKEGWLERLNLRFEFGQLEPEINHRVDHLNWVKEC